MGKIVLLVPKEEMLRQAHNILQEKQFTIQDMRVIQTENAVAEARSAIADGATIIIARGLQASLIKKHTDIPIVEITVTAQEMALLITQAKQIVKKSRPAIAVVGFRNMFCDMTYFNDLFEIELHTYFVRDASELNGAVGQAARDGADLIIGGDTAVLEANRIGVPSLFVAAVGESLRQAFFMAERMDYAMSAEKKSASRIETLLDYVPGGVIWLDAGGAISAANPAAERLLNRRQEELKGKRAEEILPQISREELQSVLRDEKEYSFFLKLGAEQVLAVLAPVIYEDRADEAILTFHTIRRSEPAAALSKNQKTPGGRALYVFDDILQESEAMKNCIRSARQYASSDYPVTLVGESGAELRMLAESIHNESLRSSAPFIDVDCAALSPQRQAAAIFGEHGAALLAHGGTLFLDNIERLSADGQYRLFHLIRRKICIGADAGSQRHADARIIVSSASRPYRWSFEGFRQDLCYLLSSLELDVPPLRQRREDLQRKIEETVRECCSRCHRYHVLTHGAMDVLMQYPWPGGLLQVEGFCERLILTARRRSLDQIIVRSLLEEMYPEKADGAESPDPEWEDFAEASGNANPQGNAEARRIIAALRRNNGSREKTAKELGISKATLWRHMKKWNITL